MMHISMNTNYLVLIIQEYNLFYQNMKRFEIIMIYCYKCIRIKVTEQIILNPVIVFPPNFMVFKNESK